MDKRRSILNVGVSITFKVITMITSIVVKRMLVSSCGIEVNGLNTLYLSVIGFLSVAELGVGSAITFCMYRPIVEEKHEQVAALYRMFVRFYYTIGSVIFLLGLLLLPALPHLAKDYAAGPTGLYGTFLLMLGSVVITYLFSAKTALFNAYKNNYITTAITSSGLLLQHILQIIVLIFSNSFVAYLWCRIIAVLAQWLITEILIRKKYSNIVRIRANLDPAAKEDLKKNIKAMFIHKIGAAMVFNLDSIIISYFVGVIALGEYSNYLTVLSAITGILILIFNSMTSIVGHYFVGESKVKVIRTHEIYHLVNFAVGIVFYLGYYSIIDNLIAVLFSAEFIVGKTIKYTITLNAFVQFMRQNTLMFREATGAFYYDRWKPLLEGIINTVLSIAFVKKFGIAGVLAATIVTNLMICHIVEPYVLYKFSFSTSPFKYYVTNYGMIVIFVVAMMVMDRCIAYGENQFLMILRNGTVSVMISAVICAAAIFVDKYLKLHTKRGEISG